MSIIVCPLHDVEAAIRLRQPTHVISLLSPTADPVALPHYKGALLSLRFHDIDAPRERLIAPTELDVAAIIAFARTAQSDATILVHCWAGVSRSTAAAYILQCLLHPQLSEMQSAMTLRAKAPYATPNALLVAHGDRLLGRDGRMNAAIRTIGRGADTAWGSIHTI